jgi:predicted nucleic acid-binding protein
MLLDTSGILCCCDPGERRHGAAVDAYGKSKTRVTHNYVLAEFVALAESRRQPRKAFLTTMVEIVTDPKIEVVWVDRNLHHEAMKLLLSQLDKTYSLCDAVSFLLMRQHSIQEALTTDHHFEQAGFVRLLDR